LYKKKTKKIVAVPLSTEEWFAEKINQCITHFRGDRAPVNCTILSTDSHINGKITDEFSAFGLIQAGFTQQEIDWLLAQRLA
jgi:hypothetical protein